MTASDDLKIRAATTADIDRLVTVYHSAYQENRELGFPASAESVSSAELETWLREHELYVAERAGTVFGAVRVTVTDEPRAKISRFAVHDEYKGQGIGGQLLDWVEQRLRDRGVDTAWLTTPPEHPTLPEYYASRGYEETEPYPLENREYDEVVMEKEL